MEKIIDALDKFTTGKDLLATASGILGGVVAMAYGQWSEGLTTLVILMVLDYASGLIVAGLFQASPKTPNGGLESRAGWKGLVRKVATLLIVMAAHRVDLALDTTYLMNATVIGFIVNELISLVENAGLMGVPMPKAITKAIELLTARADVETTEETAEEH